MKKIHNTARNVVREIASHITTPFTKELTTVSLEDNHLVFCKDHKVAKVDIQSGWVETAIALDACGWALRSQFAEEPWFHQLLQISLKEILGIEGAQEYWTSYDNGLWMPDGGISVGLHDGNVVATEWDLARENGDSLGAALGEALWIASLLAILEDNSTPKDRGAYWAYREGDKYVLLNGPDGNICEEFSVGEWISYADPTGDSADLQYELRKTDRNLEFARLMPDGSMRHEVYLSSAPGWVSLALTRAAAKRQLLQKATPQEIAARGRHPESVS